MLKAGKFPFFDILSKTRQSCAISINVTRLYDLSYISKLKKRILHGQV